MGEEAGSDEDLANGSGGDAANGEEKDSDAESGSDGLQIEFDDADPKTTAKANGKSSKSKAKPKVKSRDQDMEMEITFEPGLKEIGKKMLKNASKKEVCDYDFAAASGLLPVLSSRQTRLHLLAHPLAFFCQSMANMSAWEKYLEQRKQKRKERRRARDEAAEKQQSGSGEGMFVCRSEYQDLFFHGIGSRLFPQIIYCKTTRRS